MPCARRSGFWEKYTMRKCIGRGPGSAAGVSSGALISRPMGVPYSSPIELVMDLPGVAKWMESNVDAVHYKTVRSRRGGVLARAHPTVRPTSTRGNTPS